MTSKRLTPVCACLIFILAPAFASRQLPDYPARAASDYSIKAAGAGAIVGIEPFDESGLQKTYFNARMTEKGILPADLSGKENRSIASKLGSGGLLDLGQMRDITDERENMMKKQIRSKTLAPQSSVAGFVYIPVPRSQPRPKIHLQVPITGLQTGETTVLNLEF